MSTGGTSAPTGPPPSGGPAAGNGSATPASNNAHHEIVLVLLAGLMAAVVGLGGAYLGSHATIVTQRDQARELRQAEARAKRAEVYAGFLDAAERYSFATEATSDATRESVSQAGSVKAACSAERERADRACGIRRSIFNRQQDARVDFQGALNQVYVYGSPRGIRAAGKIAESLPPSVYGVDFEVGDVKLGEFSAGYNAVLDTMCREVSAEPRPTCL